jgi:hypothetical protein
VRALLAIVLLGWGCAQPNPAYLGRPDAALPGTGRDGPAVDGPTPVDAAVPADVALPVDLSALDLAVDAPTVPATDALPASTLLGHWTFEEPMNESMVLDRSTYGHHARLENLDPASARVEGERGMALSLPATAVNPGAMVPVTSSPIRSLQRFTVAAWVYRPSIPADSEMGIISRQIGTGPRQVFNLGFRDDELVIVLSLPTGSEYITLTAGNVKTPATTWFHVAATWDGAELVLYQAGQRVAAVNRTWTLPDTSNPLYLGTNKNMNNDEPLVGMLDDVRLYSVALTAGQISALASDIDP